VSVQAVSGRRQQPQVRSPLIRSPLTTSMPSHSFHRTDRVNAELRREIGALVHALVRDHALPQASVSDVEVTRDLDVATVWVTALQPERSAEVVKALKEAAKDLRHDLAHSMRMRRVPELRFKYDDSVDRGERIDALLRDDAQEKKVSSDPDREA
jgi:ribosome-binding factor A